MQDKDPCPSPIVLYDAESGARYLVPCKGRRCLVCGPQRWRPVKLASLHAGLRGNDSELLVLLLTAPGDEDADAFNGDASRRWHHFMTLVRREFPAAPVEFWRVAELQARGHVHFHVVLRGLVFFPVGTLRRLATTAGFGVWVGVRRPRDYPRGAAGLGGYLGKYLLKDALRRLPLRMRLVTMSRGWRVDWVTRARQAAPGRYLVRIGRAAPWEAFSAPWEPVSVARPVVLGDQLRLDGRRPWRLVSPAVPARSAGRVVR